MNFDTFVLAAATATLDDEPAAREHADAIEFRMDLAEDPLSQLRTYDGELPIIATNRAEWEGGEASRPGRLDALAEAAQVSAVEAIDVELHTLETPEGVAIAENVRAAEIPIIASVHDFERTPSSADLRKLLRRASKHGDIGKLAVTAQTSRDVLDLLGATQAISATGRTVATMAMGKVGRHSRAVAPLYGSRIGYAPVDPADATAPGQYDLATLRTLVDQLRSE